MLITKLETLNLPVPLGRAIVKDTRNLKKKSQRWVKSTIRRTRSRAITAIRSQYYPHYAMADAKKAVLKNEDIFISAAIVTLVLSFAAAFTSAEFLIMFMNTAFALSEITRLHIGFFVAAAAGMLAVFYGWIVSFALNMVSWSTMEGATGKKLRSIRKTARNALARASRVTTAWFALLGIVALPIVLLLAGTYVYFHYTMATVSQMLEFIPNLLIASTAWLCLAVMNFGLAPQVALFEADLNLKQVLSKSRRLVLRRGRIFLLISHVLLWAALVMSLGLAWLAEKLILVNQWLFLATEVILISIVFSSFMTAFYKKRRQARK